MLITLGYGPFLGTHRYIYIYICVCVIWYDIILVVYPNLFQQILSYLVGFCWLCRSTYPHVHGIPKIGYPQFSSIFCWGRPWNKPSSDKGVPRMKPTSQILGSTLLLEPRPRGAPDPKLGQPKLSKATRMCIQVSGLWPMITHVQLGTFHIFTYSI